MANGKLRFGTLEWWQEFQNRWNADPKNFETLKGFGTGVYIVADRPNLEPIAAVWDENGKLVQVSEVKAVVSANADVWRDTATGVMSATTALIQGKQKVIGPVSVAVRYKKGIDLCNKIFGQIPTEWVWE
jgi:putative sterol carrier protein